VRHGQAGLPTKHTIRGKEDKEWTVVHDKGVVLKGFHYNKIF
jgi:hypothetical protein